MKQSTNGILMLALAVLTFEHLMTIPCHGRALTASWYSQESCRREKTSGIMANGKRLKDERYTAASWDYSLGTILRVKNINNRKTVLVEVTDRGPARRLYREGRVIDLSEAAFKSLAALKTGVIEVIIERVQ